VTAVLQGQHALACFAAVPDHKAPAEIFESLENTVCIVFCTGSDLCLGRVITECVCIGILQHHHIWVAPSLEIYSLRHRTCLINVLLLFVHAFSSPICCHRTVLYCRVYSFGNLSKPEGPSVDVCNMCYEGMVYCNACPKLGNTQVKAPKHQLPANASVFLTGLLQGRSDVLLSGMAGRLLSRRHVENAKLLELPEPQTPQHARTQ
jgi:hypothetical protein